MPDDGSISTDAPSTDDPRPVAALAMGGRDLRVEAVAPTDGAALRAAWSDLASRCLVPNVFLQPAFALPLLQHACSGRSMLLVLVWEENGATSFGKLVGLCIIDDPSLRSRTIRAFRHPQATVGALLLDRAGAIDAAISLVAWLAQRYPRAEALLFDNLPDEAVSVLEAVRPVRVLDARHRAVLRRAEGAEGLPTALTGRRRKELARQSNRLSERGQRRFTSADTPDAVLDAVERFLALEVNGWKGQRGTALLSDVRLATFARAMTRMMAEEDRCRVDALEMDGAPVAMGIVLRDGDRCFFWKTAFDERFAEFSPGVQFAAELTRRQLRDDTTAVTDSCAMPDHPMIDRLWRDRMTFSDVMVSLRGSERRGFRAAVAAERVRRRLRARAKRWLARLRQTLRKARTPT